ncbi:uncharacterized protein FIBRA_01826 [Fibroporia radiculosa]|uniref:Uncharacterized protein n=1 Tax=Fibroporia radiculosa TaxID=599839 RepID=J4HTY2_9APHY|nr:uncharacterized protein FIBRA_01826 [Fibroporia radiculosa]CCL99802.1 predicted protein [Fibroporia radiculosa]
MTVSLVDLYLKFRGLSGRSSGPYRLQSVTLCGWAAVYKFKEMFERMSPPLRRVQNLFISDLRPHRTLDELPDLSQLRQDELLRILIHYSFSTEDKENLLHKFRPIFGLGNRLTQVYSDLDIAAVQALDRILQLTASHLRTLTMPKFAHILANPLPALEELTIINSSSFLSLPSPITLSTKVLFPSLRHLRLVRCHKITRHFVQASVAPALTPLYLSRNISLSAPIIDSPPTDHVAQGAPASSTEMDFVPCVEHVIIRLAPHQLKPTMPQIRLYGERRLLRSCRLTLLLPQPGYRQPSDDHVWADAKCDWLQRIMGREGCWKIDPSEVMDEIDVF